MNKRKLLPIMLSAVMVLGTAGCNGSATSTTGGGETSATTSGAANQEFSEATAAPIDESAPTGTIKWLVYEDLIKNDATMVALFEDRYGGLIEQEITSSAPGAYLERLGVLIASDLSPDIVRYEWVSFPHGISKNFYTPLDSYIDINSELWSGMKEAAEQFVYNGKHYYFPYKLVDNYSLNYNKLVLEEYGLDDPMELYMNNEWTWSSFEELVTAWCDADDNHIGYTGVGPTSFIATTGTTVIDVTPNGEILNNLKSQSVQRTMEWLETLAKQGYFGEGYVAPQEAFKDGNLLFLGMQASWAYSAAWEQLVKDGVDCEMAFIPFPRDEKADDYYCAFGTYGYMVPTGAKNVKGAVDWINLNRIETTDEENIAEARAKALDSSTKYYPKCPECKYSFLENETDDLDKCPECGAARKVKFNAYYTEEQYDIMLDMTDPTRGKFKFVFDDYYGFNQDVTNIFEGTGEEALLGAPLFNGGSFTQLRDQYYNTVEGYLDSYRDKMAADKAAG